MESVEAGPANQTQQFRWIIIFYHATEESYRVAGEKWFDTMEECIKDGDDQEFDYCCGYGMMYESRPKAQ